MRLFTLALPLAAALVLVVPATAARKPPPTPTPTAFGTPAFAYTPSADGIHRDITLTVPVTHQGTVAVRMTVTANGVVNDLGTAATFRGTGSDTFKWSILGTDGCFPPLPGDTVSYHLQLVEVHGLWREGAVLDELTTPTYVIT
jgi:hypothetical protein